MLVLGLGGPAAIAVAAGQGQAESMTVDTCIEFFRHTERAMSTPDANRCAALVARSDDQARRAELIDLALSWAQYLDTTVTDRVELARDPQASRKKTLLYAVVGHGLGPLCGNADYAPKILRVLVKVLTTTEHSLHAPDEFYELLGRLNVPEESRRDAVLQILDYWRSAPALSAAWLSMIEPSYFPYLVARVEASDDPGTFHFCAAAALAHFGYQGILPRLGSLRPTFKATHPNLEGYLVRFAWQIDVQNPPEKLLAYLRSEPGPRIEERLWALQRAVKLGISKPEIRAAILDYAAQVPPGRRGVRQGLSSLKKVALEVGVLHDDDLPDVKLRKREPTP